MPKKIEYVSGEMINGIEFIEDLKSYKSSCGKAFRIGKFKCYCGNVFTCRILRIKSKHTKSCGCLKNNWLSSHPLYVLYRSIIGRVTINETSKHFKNYASRGIVMCKEWKDNPKSFFDWAFINGYKEGLQIDRIDNNGNYEPSNCRFVTPKENNRNRRDNHILLINGEAKCIAEWGEIAGIKQDVISGRVRLGWEKSRLFTPVRSKRVIINK